VDAVPGVKIPDTMETGALQGTTAVHEALQARSSLLLHFRFRAHLGPPSPAGLDSFLRPDGVDDRRYEHKEGNFCRHRSR
jgi:hypothetical protein